jgi:hypothetical protein
MMMTIEKVAREVVQGLFCKLPGKVSGDVAGAAEHVLTPQVWKEALDRFGKPGSPKLDLSGMQIHLPDIAPTKGTLTLTNPIVDNTTFRGGVDTFNRRSQNSLELVNPQHTTRDATLTLNGLGDFSRSSNPPEVSITGGNLNTLALDDVIHPKLKGVNAETINATKTRGLEIHQAHPIGVEGPSQIGTLNLKNSDVQVTGGSNTPAIKELHIHGDGGYYPYEKHNLVTTTDSNAIGNITFTPKSRGKVEAHGLVPTVNVGQNAKATLNEHLGDVTATNASDVRINDPKTLKSLYSQNSPTSLTSHDGTLGDVRIENSPSLSLYLRNVQMGGLGVNGSRLDYINIDHVKTKSPIRFDKNTLVPSKDGSGPLLKIANTSAPQIRVTKLSSTEPKQKASVLFEGNQTSKFELTGENLQGDIINPQGLSGFPKPNVRLGLENSTFDVKTSTNIFPYVSVADSPNSKFEFSPSRGVQGEVVFPKIDVSKSRGLNLQFNDGVRVNNLGITKSKLKLRSNGTIRSVNADTTELLSGSLFSAKSVKLTSPKGDSGLRITEPTQRFTREQIPQIVTTKAEIIDTHGLQGLEIAGQGHQVDIRNSTIGGAQLTGGAGRNVTLDHSQIMGTRVVRTKAEKGKPVSYPGVNDEASTIRGLREEGGLRSTIQNIGYSIQDAWGSLFGGDRRRV